ncbi:hypothetical protein CAPTEDRAFT_104042 [Capitella teleta]|uniref:Sulfotransferase domain-containing protein n=2 Tax=Capitella teleta TaxID=283909 RepID=R7TAX1_CAPTE|nr:hypothetical protein CAPTEDRAFT_104042 [Capitella teleta]|eukprot:ELT88642.1 hypothetical protein CAPTEDRAFT_104042 [Capitella teleta]
MPWFNRSIHIFTETEVANEPRDVKNRAFPHALIIGARKAGTSALQDFLKLHPQIRAPSHEPGWFFIDSEYTKGLGYYRTRLPPLQENQISIEKSAEYFHFPYVPERVWSFNSSMKILLIVRDPFVRLVSDYMFLKRYDKAPHCIEKKYTFEELAYNFTTGRVNTRWACLKRSVYFVWFQEWLKFFPREQILVVDGDDFAENNPGTELIRVENFLGVEPLLTEKYFFFNETKGFYCVKKTGCLHEGKGHEPISVAMKVERMIRDYLRPLNRKFYEMVGKDFGWQ